MLAYSRRPGAHEYVAYYSRYVSLVPDGDIMAILESQRPVTADALRAAPPLFLDRGYAPGKWSVREVAGHLVDVERIMSTRLLRIARADTTPLPGFDENLYVPAGEFGARPLDDILGEWTAVRQSTLALLRGLPAAAWTRSGTANANPVTARGIAWIIAGHELHHRAIVVERYH